MRRHLLLSVPLALALGCDSPRSENQYDPRPGVGINETVPVGHRGTEPGGTFSRNPPPREKPTVPAMVDTPSLENPGRGSPTEANPYQYGRHDPSADGGSAEAER